MGEAVTHAGRRALTILALVLIGCCESVAPEQTLAHLPQPNAASQERRNVALLISVSLYDSVGALPLLESTGWDSAEIARTLAERFGFDTTLLTDDRRLEAELRGSLQVEIVRRVNDQEIDRAFKKLSAEPGPPIQNLFVMFSGHGVAAPDEGPLPGIGFLIPSNGVAEPRSHLVPVGKVLQQLYATEARHIFLTIATCDAGEAVSARADFASVLGPPRRSAQVLPSERASFEIFAAGASTDKFRDQADGRRLSPFGAVLSTVLESAAPETQDYLSGKRVVDLTRDLFLSQYGRDNQSPVYHEVLLNGGSIAFSPRSPVALPFGLVRLISSSDEAQLKARSRALASLIDTVIDAKEPDRSILLAQALALLAGKLEYAGREEAGELVGALERLSTLGATHRFTRRVESSLWNLVNQCTAALASHAPPGPEDPCFRIVACGGLLLARHAITPSEASIRTLRRSAEIARRAWTKAQGKEDTEFVRQLEAEVAGRMRHLVALDALETQLHYVRLLTEAYLPAKASWATTCVEQAKQLLAVNLATGLDAALHAYQLRPDRQSEELLREAQFRNYGELCEVRHQDEILVSSAAGGLLVSVAGDCATVERVIGPASVSARQLLQVDLPAPVAWVPIGSDAVMLLDRVGRLFRVDAREPVLHADECGVVLPSTPAEQARAQRPWSMSQGGRWLVAGSLANPSEFELLDLSTGGNVPRSALVLPSGARWIVSPGGEDGILIDDNGSITLFRSTSTGLLPIALTTRRQSAGCTYRLSPDAQWLLEFDETKRQTTLLQVAADMSFHERATIANTTFPYFIPDANAPVNQPSHESTPFSPDSDFALLQRGEEIVTLDVAKGRLLSVTVNAAEDAQLTCKFSDDGLRIVLYDNMFGGASIVNLSTDELGVFSSEQLDGFMAGALRIEFLPRSSVVLCSVSALPPGSFTVLAFDVSERQPTKLPWRSPFPQSLTSISPDGDWITTTTYGQDGRNTYVWNMQALKHAANRDELQQSAASLQPVEIDRGSGRSGMGIASPFWKDSNSCILIASDGRDRIIPFGRGGPTRMAPTALSVEQTLHELCYCESHRRVVGYGAMISSSSDDSEVGGTGMPSRTVTAAGALAVSSWSHPLADPESSPRTTYGFAEGEWLAKAGQHFIRMTGILTEGTLRPVSLMHPCRPESQTLIDQPEDGRLLVAALSDDESIGLGTVFKSNQPDLKSVILVRDSDSNHLVTASTAFTLSSRSAPPFMEYGWWDMSDRRRRFRTDIRTFGASQPLAMSRERNRLVVADTSEQAWVVERGLGLSCTPITSTDPVTIDGLALSADATCLYGWHIGGSLYFADLATVSNGLTWVAAQSSDIANVISLRNGLLIRRASGEIDAVGFPTSQRGGAAQTRKNIATGLGSVLESPSGQSFLMVIAGIPRLFVGTGDEFGMEIELLTETGVPWFERCEIGSVAYCGGGRRLIIPSARGLVCFPTDAAASSTAALVETGRVKNMWGGLESRWVCLEMVTSTMSMTERSLTLHDLLSPASDPRSFTILIPPNTLRVQVFDAASLLAVVTTTGTYTYCLEAP